MDGYVNFSETLFGSVVFHHKDADTGVTLADDETVTAKVTGDKFDFSNYIISIDGYTYDQAVPSDVVVEKGVIKSVTLCYKKGTFHYTVYYKEKDTEKELARPKIATVSYGSTVNEDARDIRGYKVVGDSSQSLKVDAQNKSITFHYVAKQGKVGYYLADSSATWDDPADTVRIENLKWYYNYGFAKGDTVKVTKSEPTATGKAFIGWLDKERGSQPAAIREAGDTVTYIYDGAKTYTLDALWVSLDVTGYKDTYDGKEHGLAVDVAINKGSDLAQQYQDQAKKFIKQGAVQYSTDDGKTWSDVAPKYKNAGTYPVKVKIDVTVDGKPSTLKASANIVIEPATLEVSTASAKRAYNGQPLTAGGSVEGFVNGETAGFKTTGSQTAVGDSPNTYELAWDGTAKPTNYKIAENLGKLTVTEHDGEVVAAAGSYTGAYDGEPHGVDVTVTGLPEGYAVKAAGSKATATDVTDGAVTAEVDELAIVNAQGEDVTGRLNIKREPGSIVITPAPYSVTTESATRAYDGTALTATGRIDGLVNGETANLKVTGSQTNVGASDNTYAIEWAGTAKESNYKLESESIGTLTVTAAPDSPTPDDQSKDQGVFNGSGAGLVQTGDMTGLYGTAAIIAAVIAAFVSLLAARRRKE